MRLFDSANIVELSKFVFFWNLHSFVSEVLLTELENLIHNLFLFSTRCLNITRFLYSNSNLKLKYLLTLSAYLLCTM